MKDEVRGVEPPGFGAEERNVQLKREPGKGVPVAQLERRERPSDSPQREAVSNPLEVSPIIEADQLVLDDRRVDQESREQHATERCIGAAQSRENGLPPRRVPHVQPIGVSEKRLKLVASAVCPLH
jgi:hypothetical protein